MSATVAKVEMAFATGANPNAWTLDVSPFPVTLGPAEIDVWTDVTDDVQTLNITRGRSRELDAFAPGTCQVLMLNEDRDYDPLNLDGPHVNTEATQERQSTLSDGTITDDMRNTGEQGDGLPTPAGMGPWPAVTQLIANPDNPSSYTTSNSSLASGSADGFPGDWSIELTAATSAQQWEHRHTVSGSTAGRAYSGQFRVIGDASSEGKTLVLELVERGGASGDAVMGAPIIVEVPATDTRFTITRTVVTNDRTRVDLRVRAPSAGSTWANGDKYRFSWTQLELGSIATPFTPTSRVAGRIQAAVADLGITAETGWVFGALRMGINGSQANFNRILNWSTDTSNRMFAFIDSTSGGRFSFARSGGGVTGTNTFVSAFSAADARSLGLKWTAAGLQQSVNGSDANTLTAQTDIPTLPSSLDIGSNAGTSQHFSGNFDWVVTGSNGSAVSNADWAALHALAETLDRAPTWAEVQSVLSVDARLSMEALLPMVDGEFQVVARKTQIRPGRRIRVTAEHPDTNVEYPVFYGIVREWDVNYPTQIGAVVARATDLMTDLAVTDVEVTTSAGTAGNALRQVMAAAGISRFTAVSGSSTLQETVFSTPALQATQLIEQSELGTAYTDRDGIIRFEGRNTVLSQERSAVSQATFGAGHLLFRDLELDYDSDQIRNAISLTRDGGTAQTAESSASVAEYGKRSFSRSGLMNATDSELEDLADYLLGGFSEPAVRVRSITIDPMNHPDLLTQALAREIRDRVTVQYQPPSGGTQISQEVFISGIQHQLSSGGAMTTKFSFETTDLAYGWVLDVSAFPVRLGA
jgi:hypothetical protein